MNSFHNTINLGKKDFIKANKQAITEEVTVMSIFSETAKPMTSFDVYKHWIDNKITPFDEGCELCKVRILFNIRRAMSNLKHRGELLITGITKIEKLGRPNNYYYAPDTCSKAELQKIGCLELF